MPHPTWVWPPGSIGWDKFGPIPWPEDDPPATATPPDSASPIDDKEQEPESARPQQSRSMIVLTYVFCAGSLSCLAYHFVADDLFSTRTAMVIALQVALAIAGLY